MEWLIILVILLVAFGPVLWLRPSRRDRRLAALRQEARAQHLTVEMRRLPKQNPSTEERVTSGGKPLPTTVECAVYQRPLPRRVKHLPSWRIVRGADGLPALPGWVFELRGKPDHPQLQAMLDALEPTIEDLPGDVIAVEFDGVNLGAYWLEGVDTNTERVVDLARRLQAGAEALIALEARLEAQREADAEAGND